MLLLSHHRLLCGTCKSLWLKFRHRDLQELGGANPTQTIPNPTSAFLPAGIQEYKWSPPSLELSWDFTCQKVPKLHSPPGKSQTSIKGIPHSLQRDCTWVDTWVDRFQVSNASAVIASVESGKINKFSKHHQAFCRQQPEPEREFKTKTFTAFLTQQSSTKWINSPAPSTHHNVSRQGTSPDLLLH